ncbi:putative 2,3-dihydroxybiphenyl-1,2-dioxygenase or glyoxalase/bleomycin resistance protein [Actinomadura sp. NBRC 104425]|uniref:VOC family protein n=1 Tax=Actinomadura sp. NBRC 104425 TaxID=3032204 RepID=UPI0024A49111|nr:VOC family protein [Actinomadura sp. NBRC 104425]GLZ09792.1 putative 2,3-dihydroxybiphenyl-1,2-dioxygenase or glyoxalase/bleomycin resistance protein [Actinomadura sp. NBRC 104425]
MDETAPRPAGAAEITHSPQGGLRGEHPGRSRNPVIKVADLAWLEFEKPDLHRAEMFARDFGFAVATRTPDALYLRGTLPGTYCLVVRRGPVSRFVGPVFAAADGSDLSRLARAAGTDVRELDGPGGGRVVALRDPSGVPVRVVHGTEQLRALPEQAPLPLNSGTTLRRTNAPQRPPREPARIQRLGHVVLETPVFGRALDWYLDTLGMIVSDFLFLDGQRERGPTMAFIRCDRGADPADHHTLAMHLGPGTGYVHSAYQVADLDALAAGGEYLAERGYRRAWGIGRHIQGSQIFDYWRDPDRLMLEHFTDGDRFDASIAPGWAPMTATGLAQWGPPVTRDFLGVQPSPTLVRTVLRALRDDNEIDTARLTGLMKAMNS